MWLAARISCPVLAKPSLQLGKLSLQLIAQVYPSLRMLRHFAQYWFEESLSCLCSHFPKHFSSNPVKKSWGTQVVKKLLHKTVVQVRFVTCVEQTGDGQFPINWLIVPLRFILQEDFCFNSNGLFISFIWTLHFSNLWLQTKIIWTVSTEKPKSWGCSVCWI